MFLKSAESASYDVFNEVSNTSLPQRSHVKRRGAVRRARSSADNKSVKRRPPLRSLQDSKGFNVSEDAMEEDVVLRTRKLSLPLTAQVTFDSTVQPENESENQKELGGGGEAANFKACRETAEASNSQSPRATLCQAEHMVIEDSFGSSEMASTLNNTPQNRPASLSHKHLTSLSSASAPSVLHAKDGKSEETPIKPPKRRISTESDPYSKDVDLILSPIEDNPQEAKGEQLYMEADLAYERPFKRRPPTPRQCLELHPNRNQSNRASPVKEPARVTFLDASSGEK